MFITTGQVGIAGIIATLAGTLGVAFLSHRRDVRRAEIEVATEHERWKREDIARWAEKRLVAHANFLSASRRYINSLYSVYHSTDLASDRPNYDELEDSLTRALVEMEMLALPETRTTAGALFRTLLQAGEQAFTLNVMGDAETGYRAAARRADLKTKLDNAEKQRSTYLQLAQAETGTAPSG